jgi:transposase InsO family protein
MKKMGLQAIYPKGRTRVMAKGYKIYLYLLRNLAVARLEQVWSADITYIPMLHGFMYLVAIIDWYGRYIVAWQLFDVLDVLERALSLGRPEIFDTIRACSSPRIVYLTPGSSQYPHQHGRTGMCVGQYLYRTALAFKYTCTSTPRFPSWKNEIHYIL